MNWTNKKPTKSGWYWCTYDYYAHIVFVNKSYGKWQFVHHNEDEGSDGDMHEWSSSITVDEANCKWAGPLKVPS